MITTRTPFRISLGGGSTDLPAYYREHGGFVFAVTVNLYMYLGLLRPPIDDLIRVKYRKSEEVERLSDLNHNLARAALQRTGIGKMIEISSLADVPDGTGLGSSGAYLVGLLNALHALKGENVSRRQLAEEAFEIATDDLKLPDGKQDFYTAAFGNFVVMDIKPDGSVEVDNADISRATQREFEERTLLFYTGVRRPSSDVLSEQQDKVRQNIGRSVELKHATKEIGKKVLAAFLAGNLDEFGRLMDEHWKLKREMSDKMSNPQFDALYERARNAGALGGKLIGAGGGGFFLIYCQEGAESAVRRLFAERNMREIDFRVDSTGTQVLVNRMQE